MFIAAGHAMQGHRFTVRLVGLQFNETAFKTAIQSKISDLLFYTNLEISAKICTHILFQLKTKQKIRIGLKDSQIYQPHYICEHF